MGGRLSRARRLVGTAGPRPRCRAARRPAVAVTPRTRRRASHAAAEGTERDTRQPEDTTAPRKSAAALRATLADGWAAPALTSKRRDAPHRAAPRRSRAPWTPLQPCSLALHVASVGLEPGQSYDQYMQTHESPKRAPLTDYETTASTEERGPVLGRATATTRGAAKRARAGATPAAAPLRRRTDPSSRRRSRGRRGFPVTGLESAA